MLLQASLNLPKVNVMVLQASVVEEMCAFSALDRVKDITCVSLLSLGIKGTRFQLCKTSQSKKTVQVYQQNQVCVRLDIIITEPIAYSDSVGTWEKCHCNQIVTVSRGSLLTNQSFGNCKNCH